jgi:hypothetical protein
MAGVADSLGTFAGAAGVGALCILGVFLLLDGRAPTLFPTVEEYAKTATWGVVAAVPVLAIAYVIGLVLITASCFAVRGVFGPSLLEEAADTARVSNVSAKDSVLAQEYTRLKQERDVLGGASLALLVLAIGALSETKNLDHLKLVIGVAAAGAIIAAVALLFSAGMKGRQAHTFASFDAPSAQHKQIPQSP